MEPEVDEASRQLRAAVIAADHAGAERAASHYVEALQKLWEALPESERAVSPVPSKARELLAWAREMTLIQRNLAADQHAVLQKASRYHGIARREASLQVKG
jgi:hypothetical protein